MRESRKVSARQRRLFRLGSMVIHSTTFSYHSSISCALTLHRSRLTEFIGHTERSKKPSWFLFPNTLTPPIISLKSKLAQLLHVLSPGRQVRSAPSSQYSPSWNASTYWTIAIVPDIGAMISRLSNSWNFYNRLLQRKIYSIPIRGTCAMYPAGNVGAY